MVVKNFAGIFDLSYGGYMGALVGAVFSILQIFVIRPEYPDDDDDNDGITDKPETVTDSPHEDEEEDTVRGVFLLFVIFGILLLVSSVLLAFGTLKRISRWVLPWLVVFFACVLFILILEMVPEFIDDDNYSAWYFLLIVAFLTVSFYLWIVVYSLYKELVEEEMTSPPV